MVELDGNPWFVAADVCRALDMSLEYGTNQWLKPLNDDERYSLKRGDLPDLFSGSRAPSYTCISENGLYRLVMRSDKPQAREFQDWVTREVLPAIRKDGMYVAGEEKVRTGEMSEDEMTLLVIERLKAKTDRLVAERDALAVQTATDAPKVAVHDRLLDATTKNLPPPPTLC